MSATVDPQRWLFASIVAALAVHVSVLYAYLPATSDDRNYFDCVMGRDFTHVETPDTPELDREQAIESARLAGVLGQGEPAPDDLFERDEPAGTPESWLVEPKQPEVHVVLGIPTAVGPLDRAVARRFVKRHLRELERCYRQVLVENTELRANVTVELAIRDDGSVRTATAITTDHPRLAACIAGAIRAIEFPPAYEGTSVVYPISFIPGPQQKRRRPQW